MTGWARYRAAHADARIARIERRRVNRVRRMAARHTPIALAADGTARPVYSPGVYVPYRGTLCLPPDEDAWDAAFARIVLGDAPTEPAPRVAGGAGVHAGSRDHTDRADRVSELDMLAAARRIARAHGRPVSDTRLCAALGITPDTARRLRDQVNAELYPGGAR